MPRPRRKGLTIQGETVGRRIKRLRLANGLTQIELGKRIGVSQRMVTYYEVEGVCPPPDLLLKLARALDVSTDELLGQKDRPEVTAAAPTSLRLWRRLRKLEQLTPHDRNSVLKMIDALAEQTARRQAS